MNSDEFKEIWDILIRHKDEEWNIDNLIDDCEKAYENEDYIKVLNLSEKILEVDNNNEKALEYKLFSLFNLNKYKDVLQVIDEAIKKNPQNYNFYNLKAFIYTDLYNIDEAINCFNKSFALGGFDQEDSDVSYYRAKCYLRKAREEHYLRNEDNQALKSLNVYLKKYPEDKLALDLKHELTQDYAPFKYAEKLFYFERKAEESYKYDYLKESYKCYKNQVLKAVMEFKKNVPNIEYLGYDFVNRCTVYELENFKWYEEVLFKCLEEFDGNYQEFFEKLYEISSDTIDACLDKAKLYSKVYDDKLTVDYVKELLKKCPDNIELREFYDQICFIQHVYEVADNCQEFKDYNTIEEYIEDVILCVVAQFPYYDEEGARKAVLKCEDYIKEAYSKQVNASEVAWDFVILP